MKAMESCGRYPLKDHVDEFFVGGQEAGKKGGGKENKKLVVLAIEKRGRGISRMYGYVKVLKKNHVAISMTEDNHCYENALAERVNGILKDEYLLDSTFKDFAHAEKSCREAIKLYNTRRPHHALKFKTPKQIYHAA